MSESTLVGLFDDKGDGTTSRVKYNDGTDRVEAVVTHVVDQDTLVLASWSNGVLTHLNGGNPVPRRSEADYGPEGGGVTWDF